MSETNVKKNMTNAVDHPKTVSAEEEAPRCFKFCETARLGALVPGIIHNLSTPLSGVIGGIQLLEMRSLNIAESIEKLSASDREKLCDILCHVERNQKNIELVSRNAKNLSDLLQNLVERTSRFSIKAPDIYSLNQLVETELKFLEFNMIFKHRVRRTVKSANELPPLRCSFPIVVGAFDEIIYSAIELYGTAQDSLLEIAFETSFEAEELVLRIACNVEPSRFETDTISDSLFAYSRQLMEKHFECLRGDGWIVERQAGGLGTEFILKHAPLRLASKT